MTPEARAARERKQKIFVAVGGVILLAILAIQLPKILGGSSTPEAAPAPAPAETTPGQAPSSAAPASLDAQAVLPALEGTKLRSFSVFSRKDPFVQQVVTPTEAPAGESSGSDGAKQAPKGEEKVPSQGFTTGEKSGASVTVIRVNGTPETLETGTTFPSTDPVFVLIAEQPKQKTVTIGIAGGAYANGSKTIKLKVGKPVVLENTATGAKYKLVLVSVGSGSGATAEKAAAEAPALPEAP
jgi:hypothetical protein